VETKMRSPNGPLFKRYEILAVILFLTAAAALASFNLVYWGPGGERQPGARRCCVAQVDHDL